MASIINNNNSNGGQHYTKLFENKVLTVTVDNGKEFAYRATLHKI